MGETSSAKSPRPAPVGVEAAPLVPERRLDPPAGLLPVGPQPQRVVVASEAPRHARQQQAVVRVHRVQAHGRSREAAPLLVDGLVLPHRAVVEAALVARGIGPRDFEPAPRRLVAPLEQAVAVPVAVPTQPAVPAEQAVEELADDLVGAGALVEHLHREAHHRQPREVVGALADAQLAPPAVVALLLAQQAQVGERQVDVDVGRQHRAEGGVPDEEQRPGEARPLAEHAAEHRDPGAVHRQVERAARRAHGVAVHALAQRLGLAEIGRGHGAGAGHLAHARGDLVAAAGPYLHLAVGRAAARAARAAPAWARAA